MVNKMKRVDERILSEISRYREINKYVNEQELPPPPADPAAGVTDPLAMPPADPAAGVTDPLAMPPADPAAGAAPPAPPSGEPQPVDVATDPDVEKVGEEKDKTEELDITDLVKSQKNVEKKQEEYFDNLFKHLTDLESRLGEMDNIMTKLNDLEMKVEKYRVKSPQEKLELRTLDSGPFNQKLSEFFQDKEEDMEKTGKNEYVLTKSDVEDYSNADIKKSFRDFGDEETGGDYIEVR
jgi:hypothetical protein